MQGDIVSVAAALAIWSLHFLLHLVVCDSSSSFISILGAPRVSS